MFFTLFGEWVQGGGVPRDWYTTCCCNFSPWAAQKSKFAKLIPFDIVTTQNDHATYVKDVVGSVYVVFSPYLGIVCVWGGGGFPRDWYTTCVCGFSSRAAQKSQFAKLIFLIP